MVMEGSSAAKGGLRFGDQILEVDQASLAGLSSDQVGSHSLDLDLEFMLLCFFLNFVLLTSQCHVKCTSQFDMI